MNDEAFDAAVQEAVAAATAEQKLSALERLRTSVLKERRLLRVLTILAIVVGCVGIFLAVTARQTADKAQTAVAQAEASRAEARVSSCEQFNEQQKRSIAGNDAQVREVFRSLTSDDDLSESELKALDQLFKDHDAVIAAAFPMRDCTERGIDAFFDDDPRTNPYLPPEEP